MDSNFMTTETTAAFDETENPTTEVGALLGRVLIDQGKLAEDDIETIVTHAREKKLRFGEAALGLRLITVDDLEHAMAQQFDYPFLTEGTGDYPDELVAAFKPFSPKGQALRDLRARLLQAWDSDKNRSVAIVAADVNQGCSYIAANLAVVFSQLGHKTLLVDGDMLNARLHKLFNLKNNVGLSAALVGRTPAKMVVRKLPHFRNLSIVSAGAPPPNVTELLSRRELNATVSELRAQFDIVIFDTPPMESNTGAEFIARACGESIVVIRKDHTYLQDAEELMDKLRNVKTNLIGTVMTNF